jgi:hypothetical protein
MILDLLEQELLWEEFIGALYGYCIYFYKHSVKYL